MKPSFLHWKKNNVHVDNINIMLIEYKYGGEQINPPLIYIYMYIKQKYIPFSRKLFPRTMEHIVIDGHWLPDKCFGVILHNKLNWEAHSKISVERYHKTLVSLSKPEDDLMKPPHGYLIIRWYYCIHMRGKSHDTSINKSFQNKISCAIAEVPPRTNLDSLFD